MITGFNTDVKHGTRVFHIQTEDKGDSNPYIESLIYVGGEILATKRTDYDRGDPIQELMDQQHRTMIAAIQRGRFDGPNGSLRVPDDLAPKPRKAAAADPVLPPVAAGPASAAVPPPRGEAAGADRSLDQLVLDYLASEEQLEILFSPAPELVAGRPAEFRVKAETSPSRQPVPGASVQVRILSTVAKPRTVFEGKTGNDGACVVKFALPAIAEGNAAAVVRITSPSGSAEVKCSVKRRA